MEAFPQELTAAEPASPVNERPAAGRLKRKYKRGCAFPVGRPHHLQSIESTRWRWTLWSAGKVAMPNF